MQPTSTSAPTDAPTPPTVPTLGLRPYAALRGWLLIPLLAFWTWVLWNRICNTEPYYVELCALTCMACLALAANHWRLTRDGQRGGARLWANVLLRSAYDLVSFPMLLLPVVIAMPAVSCYNDRAIASEVLLGVSPLKTTIKERALADGTLTHAGHDLKVPSLGRLAGGLVTEDGVIAVFSEKPALLMFLHPTLADGTVRWTCNGYPQRSMPASCRTYP